MLINKNTHYILPKRIVILGSKGFISSSILLKLNANHVNVLGISRNEIDLENENAAKELTSIIEPEDTIIFVAAKVPVKNEEILISNLKISQNVCKAIKNIPINHLVYISSDAVYKNSENPLTENSCAEPSSLYGVMHLSREIMLKNLLEDSLCILRLTSIYGDHDPFNGYGPNRFIRNAKKGEDIDLLGKGEERRDHVWVEDVTEITYKVILRKSLGKLNIASGKVISFFEIAKNIIKFTKSNSKIKFIPRVGEMPFNGYRPFDNTNCYKLYPNFHFHNLKEWISKSIYN